MAADQSPELRLPGFSFLFHTNKKARMTRAFLRPVGLSAIVIRCITRAVPMVVAVAVAGCLPIVAAIATMVWTSAIVDWLRYHVHRLAVIHGPRCVNRCWLYVHGLRLGINRVGIHIPKLHDRQADANRERNIVPRLGSTAKAKSHQGQGSRKARYPTRRS